MKQKLTKAAEVCRLETKIFALEYMESNQENRYSKLNYNLITGWVMGTTYQTSERKDICTHLDHFESYSWKETLCNKIQILRILLCVVAMCMCEGGLYVTMYVCDYVCNCIYMVSFFIMQQIKTIPSEYSWDKKEMFTSQLWRAK